VISKTEAHVKIFFVIILVVYDILRHLTAFDSNIAYLYSLRPAFQRNLSHKIQPA
jgi:hypothetical protein